MTTDAGGFHHTSQRAYKTVVYAVDKGLHGGDVLQSVVMDSATYLFKINFPDNNSVAMSLYNIRTILFIKNTPLLRFF